MLPDPGLIAEINQRWRAIIGPRSKPFGNPQGVLAMEGIQKIYFQDDHETQEEKNKVRTEIKIAFKKFIADGGIITYLPEPGDGRDVGWVEPQRRMMPW